MSTTIPTLTIKSTKTKPFVHQEKGAVAPQGTEADLPMSVQESLAETWVTVACRRVRGTDSPRS